MNTARKTLILAICLLVSCLMAFQIKVTENKDTFRHYDLPEEIGLASTDPNRPDAMIVWRTNDTLHIGFAPHHK